MLINELFDQPKAYPLKWEMSDYEGEASAWAKSQHGRFIEIRFIPQIDFGLVMGLDPQDVIDVEFRVDNSYEITKTGDQYRIFATVMQAMAQYVQRFHPGFLVFLSREASRNRLYHSLVGRYARQLNYRMIPWSAVPDETRRELITSTGAGYLFILASNKNPVGSTPFEQPIRHSETFDIPAISQPALARNLNEIRLSGDQGRVQKWIDSVYARYPGTWQRNHVMVWGQEPDQQFAMFELVPNPARPSAAEVKWFQAWPLRKGVGTRAMQELQRLAAADRIELTLFPWQHGRVSQAQLMRFYRGLGFEPTQPGSRNLIWHPDLDEGWREKAAAAMTAATLGYGALQQANLPQNQPTAQTVTQPAQRQDLLLRGQNALRDRLVSIAQQAGLQGRELAHFIAQAAHETANWAHMEEQPPQNTRNPRAWFSKKYDNKKILGNTRAGDGWRYRGRGDIMLTGRDNYARAGRALGLDLVNHPDLAARPDVAARIALWYWQNRVAPRVGDFERASVQDVTRTINPGLHGLDRRQEIFQRIYPSS